MKYEEPVMEIVKLEKEDVVRTSGGLNGNGPGDSNGEGDAETGLTSFDLGFWK